jgi:hypothetical protein
MPELFKPCEANASPCATRAYKVFNRLLDTACRDCDCTPEGLSRNIGRRSGLHLFGMKRSPPSDRIDRIFEVIERPDELRYPAAANACLPDSARAYR